MKGDLQKLLHTFLEKHEGEKDIIALLQETQRVYGYIPEEAIRFYSEELDISPVRFFGISTFYTQFHLIPCGRNIITACCGTACHVKGSERLIAEIQQSLDLSDEHNTTEDGEFTLEQVACVGACSIAPVVIINDRVYGKMDASKMSKELRMLKTRSPIT